MFVAVDLHIGHCYQLNTLDVVGLGFNCVLLGGQAWFRFSRSLLFYFFSPKEGFYFETRTSDHIVHRELDCNCGLMPYFQSTLEKVIRKSLG